MRLTLCAPRCLAILLLFSAPRLPGLDFQGKEFLGLTNFQAFAVAPAATNEETWFTSPALPFHIEGDQLILSWNIELAPTAYSIMEVRALYQQNVTPWFTLGIWAGEASRVPRGSLPGQAGPAGKVETDVLHLTKAASAFQVRVRVGWTDGGQAARLKFLGLSLTDGKAQPAPPAREASPAWGKSLNVPELSQMAYPGGGAWCSPASTAMALGYWAGASKQPRNFPDVPEVARAVHDPNWPGTGNWPFNTAYAGSFPHLRAYVTRFSSVAEIESWIAAGVPVIASVAYGYLKGNAEKGNGHLVVCVGFSPTGDLIINDPGTRQNIRKVFARGDFERAWATSNQTVYLIYPVDHPIPANRWGHW